MFINDWTHLGGNAAFLRVYHGRKKVRADTMLINGLARLNKIEGADGISRYTPTTVFKVIKVRRVASIIDRTQQRINAFFSRRSC